MTCLEIILLSLLVYIIIGFISYYHSESYTMAFANDKDEKCATLCDILLWPLEMIRVIADAIEDEYYG